MKLSALIERLQEIEADLREGLGDECDAEIVAAYQPNYPLAGSVLGACVLDDEDEPTLVDGAPVVWLAIGSHPHGLNPYAPRRVYEEAE